MKDKQSRKEKKRVVFLCTGNSCRSQMAEGFARHMGKDSWDVYSAGISPSQVNPLAILVMKEVGIDISHQTSNALDAEILAQANFIITLCGDAEESCPVVPPGTKKIHWPLEDPTRAPGTAAERTEKFQGVRDAIKKRVADFIHTQIKSS